jgi:TATA-box binding protein (TBP) (component of TFIID and TFIIIB)
MPDLNANVIESAMRTIEGTARNMGIVVEGMDKNKIITIFVGGKIVITTRGKTNEEKEEKFEKSLINDRKRKDLSNSEA